MHATFRSSPPASRALRPAATLSPWLYLAFCIASILPFALVGHPPIVDFPNHAARLGLQCAMGDPVVSGMYRYSFGIIPNLAADLVNVPLCGWVSPEWVLKGSIIGALALIYAAAWQIQRRLHGGANPFLLLVPAISLNVVTTIGYINFLMGIAVAIAMIAVAVSRPGTRALLLVGNAGGVLLFFSHIFALAFAVVFFLAWGLKWPLRPRDVIAAGVRTIAMFAVPLALMPFVPGEGTPLRIDYEAKYRAFFAPLLAGSGSQAVLLLGAIVIGLYLLWRDKRAALHPAMRLPLAMLAAYILVVPSQIRDAVDIDARTSVAFAWLFFASLAPFGAGWPVRAVALFAAVPLALHLTTAATHWLPFSDQVEELRAALPAIPAQASILSVTADDDAIARPNNAAPYMAYSHLASWATADRRAFNPLEFTGVGMQPLSSHGRFAALDVPASLPIPVDMAIAIEAPDALVRKPGLARHVGYAHRWPERFDYVLFYHFGSAPNFDAATLDLVRRGSFFSLLKVRRRASLSTSLTMGVGRTATA